LKTIDVEGESFVEARPSSRDGESGDHVLIAPPFKVTQSQIEEIVAKLASALDGALHTLPH
jgi:adenosylmethionine-8-amino-7-oxononanoate aminotransferase